MFDRYDPRDDDPREPDDGIHDCEEQWRSLGRGPGANASADDHDDVKHHGNEPEERDAFAHEREQGRAGLDPRDLFLRDLDVPCGQDRELVHDRDRDYRLDGSDTRTLNAPAPE